MTAQKPTRSSFVPRVVPPARRLDPDEMQRFAERGETQRSDAAAGSGTDTLAQLPATSVTPPQPSVVVGKTKQFHCKLPISLWLQLHNASGASEETDTPLTMGDIAIEALRARLVSGTPSHGTSDLQAALSAQETQIAELRALVAAKEKDVAALQATLARSSNRKGEGRGGPPDTTNSLNASPPDAPSPAEDVPVRDERGTRHGRVRGSSSTGAETIIG